MGRGEEGALRDAARRTRGGGRAGGAHLERALRARLAGESPPGGLKVGVVGESPPRGRIACCGMRARLLLQTSARAAPRSSTCRRRRRALKDERCTREGCRAPRAQQRARALRTHREAREACRGLRPPASAASAEVDLEGTIPDEQALFWWLTRLSFLGGQRQLQAGQASLKRSLMRVVLLTFFTQRTPEGISNTSGPPKQFTCLR